MQTRPGPAGVITFLVAAGTLGCVAACGAHDRSPRAAAQSQSPGSTSSSIAPTAPACRIDSLRVRFGPLLSPKTGERGVVFEIAATADDCRLIGYPHVVLRNAAGSTLPFSYLRSAGPYLLDHRPRLITVGPGAPAYFIVTKYRCDQADAGPTRRWLAATVEIRLPTQTRSTVFPAGDHAIAYCTSTGDHAGDTVDLSPFGARIQDLR